MDVLRPSHSLQTRASGLYEAHRRLPPQREAPRNKDPQSDIFWVCRILRICTMHTSLNTVRTAVINRADFEVMRDRIQMEKPLVAAGGSGGTRNEAHRRTKGWPWTRVQARKESCGLQNLTGIRRACRQRLNREEGQRLQQLEH